MTEDRQVSLAITHYNRFKLLLECFVQVLNDPRVGEIVISDDVSNDGSWERIQRQYGNHPKIKLFRNKRNLDCYFNKAEAVRKASLEWVILFDSDNVITPAYLDALFVIPKWDQARAYCPEFAEPHFNYTRFAGMVFARRNIRHYSRDKTLLTALNTANYFFRREDYLAVWDGSVNPHTADSIYQNYRWLESGRTLQVVRGLRYFHRVHQDSHYKQNFKRTGNFARIVTDKLQQLI